MNFFSHRYSAVVVAAVFVVLTGMPQQARAANEPVPYPLSIDSRNAVAVWNGLQFNSYTIGANPTCKYQAGTSELASTCRVVVATSPRGATQLVFTPPPPPSATAVRVTTTNPATALRIPIEACSFSGLEPHATLYAGATSQVIHVAASSEACASRLTSQANLEFVTAGSRISAEASKDSPQPPTDIWLDVYNLPATLAETWTIASALEPDLGSLNVRTAPNPIAVSVDEQGAPTLGVHYESDFFEQRHTPKSVAGNAVLTASEQGAPEFLYVRNQPKVTVTRMDTLLRNLQQERFRTCQCEHDKDDGTNRCEYLTNPWKVETLTWHDSAWIRYPEGLDYEKPGERELQADKTCPLKAASASGPNKRKRYPEGWVDGEVLLESLDDLTFSVFQAEAQPFEVMVTLRDPAHLERTLFATKVRLANAARRESIPLPLKDMLFVACGETEAPMSLSELAGFVDRLDGVDLVANGTTRAINEDDLRAGQCVLHYAPTRNPQALHQKGQSKRETIGSLVHFGRQEVEVVLRRGAAEKKVLWTLDPTREQSIPLPQPTDSKETGVYVVHAVVRGPMPPDVSYRPAAAVSASERPLIAAGDLEFRANLRPRGRFGWVALPIRTFVTIPVEVGGLRFPANARDLESSSDITAVQVITGRTGLLFAVEPWDYDRGTNPWPIPARLMTGMSLFRLGEGRFVPSLMSGVQFSVPVIDLPKGSADDQLGTDASLGFFWEHDLQPGGGNHLMVTLGANLLTLFGSK